MISYESHLIIKDIHADILKRLHASHRYPLERLAISFQFNELQLLFLAYFLDMLSWNYKALAEFVIQDGLPSSNQHLMRAFLVFTAYLTKRYFNQIKAEQLPESVFKELLLINQSGYKQWQKKQVSSCFTIRPEKVNSIFKRGRSLNEQQFLKNHNEMVQYILKDRKGEGFQYKVKRS